MSQANFSGLPALGVTLKLGKGEILENLQIKEKGHLTFEQYTQPIQNVLMIDGVFASEVYFQPNDLRMHSKPCKIKIAEIFKYKQDLINEHNMLKNFIWNYDNFLRPVCICGEHDRMYSITETETSPIPSFFENLSLENKREVLKQTFTALMFLQKKNILLKEFSEIADFEIQIIGEDIRVKIHLMNNADLTTLLERKGETAAVKNRIQKFIKKVGMVWWQKNWHHGEQYDETVLQNFSLDNIAEKLSLKKSLTSNEYLLATMLMAMTHLPEGKRPEWSVLLKHPFFWPPSRKNSFIETLHGVKCTNRETCNHEKKCFHGEECVDGENCNHRKKCVQMDFITDPFTNWKNEDKMKELVDTIQQNFRRPYNTQNNETLIRLLRNKFQHRIELTAEQRQDIFEIDTDLTTQVYVDFFETTFPLLVTWLWHCARLGEDSNELKSFYPESTEYIVEVRKKLNM